MNYMAMVDLSIKESMLTNIVTLLIVLRDVVEAYHFFTQLLSALLTTL